MRILHLALLLLLAVVSLAATATEAPVSSRAMAGVGRALESFVTRSFAAGSAASGSTARRTDEDDEDDEDDDEDHDHDHDHDHDGHDHDHDEDDDDEDDEEKNERSNRRRRTLTRLVSRNRLAITSASRGDEQHNVIRFDMQLSGKPGFRVRYYTLSEAARYVVNFGVRMLQFVEYEDADNDGFTDGDAVVGTRRFNSLNFGAISEVSEETSDVWMFQATASWLTLTLSIAKEAVTSRGVLLTPSSVKFDVDINGYPYTQDDTSVAIDMGVRSASTRRERSNVTASAANGGGSAVVDIGSDGIAFFSWVQYATVNNNANVTVVSRTLVTSESVEESDADEDADQTETQMVVRFSFTNAVGAQSISWDPSTGVGTASAASAAAASDSSTTGDGDASFASRTTLSWLLQLAVAAVVALAMH